MLIDKVRYPKISDYISYFSQTSGDKIAVSYQNKSWTYHELDCEVKKCANALRAIGLEKGDRIAMLANPGIDFLVFLLASTSIGCIWLGLNPKYTFSEFKYVVEHARPALLIYFSQLCGRDYCDDMRRISDECNWINSILHLKNTGLQDRNYEAFIDRFDPTLKVSLDDIQKQVLTDDPAIIVYTSGSSGKPKGALLSHYGLVFGASVQVSHFKVEDPSIICNMPINHVACIADICCTTLIKAGKIVFQDEFSPDEMLKSISSEGINIWAGVPTMFILQLEHPEFHKHDLSSIELIIWGGAPMPQETINQLALMQRRLMTAYGMTETSAHTCYSDENASLSDLHNFVGKPDPNMPCRIANDLNEQVNQGQLGELQFKGRYLMLGYYNNQDATNAAFTADGWFKTGDLGYQAEDGNIQLKGRKSDMFKSGGYNVYPREIEAVLESHPQIDMACVVGVPDLLFQEVGVAFVVATGSQSPTPDTLKELCRQHLANYKIPKKIITLSEFPKLPVGKIDKQVLRDIALNT